MFLSLYKKHTETFKHLALILVAAGLLLGGVFILWVSSFPLPDLRDLGRREVAQSTKIYDRTGQVLLYDVHQDIKRTVVTLDKISPDLRNATVAIEDAEFYQHGGLKITSILRAILRDLGTLSFTQGGSTITQQVIKNTVLTSEKSVTRKLKEWVLAIKLEQVMDKDSILSLYLNEAPYGGNIYGAQEAARTYLGKSASEVDLAEAAYLAALPNAPTFYSPYGNHVNKLEERKNLVLQRMFENHFITENQYQTARSERVTFKPQESAGITAPHFVLFVKEYLESKYGPLAVSSEGLTVVTTLDAALQAKAEEIVKHNALSNEKTFNAENAGLIAVNPKTGEILAMVGSRDYFDKEIDGNFNVTFAKRQPGSAFKPFVYATALEKGYTPSTVVFDVPTEFSTYCNPDGTPINVTDADKCYEPVDYDGLYRGPMTMRDALAQSINIPAIQFLYLAGIRDSLQTARDMGITTLTDPERYGLTLVLGGGEVTLLEMVSAYGVFANEGVRNPYASVLSVADPSGAPLENFSLSPSQVLDKNVALQITDILSDNKARTPEFGDRSALYFPGREVAVKTGTTNDFRDAWIIGYTPSLAVGAWAGNNNNTPMVKKIAGFIVAPMWREFMDAALASTSPERFNRPEEKDLSGLKPVLRGFWQGNETYTIDSISGKLATPYTPQETKMEKVIPNAHSILFWVDRNNPLGPPPEHPEEDPQYRYWEYAVQKWLSSNPSVISNAPIVPTSYDDIHTPTNTPRISIGGVDPSVMYKANNPLMVLVTGQGRYPLAKADFFLNDRFIGSSKTPPFSISFTPSDIEGVSDINTLKVVGYDSVFNKGEVTTALRVVLEGLSSTSHQ